MASRKSDRFNPLVFSFCGQNRSAFEGVEFPLEKLLDVWFGFNSYFRA